MSPKNRGQSSHALGALEGLGLEPLELSIERPQGLEKRTDALKV
jgi:hypothetical protein